MFIADEAVGWSAVSRSSLKEETKTPSVLFYDFSGVTGIVGRKEPVRWTEDSGVTGEVQERCDGIAICVVNGDYSDFLIDNTFPVSTGEQYAVFEGRSTVDVDRA